MSAAGAAIRGPFGFLLQTQAGQWVILGLGAASLFPEKCDELVRPIVRSLVLGLPYLPSSSSNNMVAPAAPIVIQTSGSGASGSATEKIVGQLLAYTVSAAGVWISYTILVNYLPDWAKEMLPVTRHVFEKAVGNLGKGIVQISEKVAALMNKQDLTHAELLEAREDIVGLRETLEGMEDTLDDAGEVQGRTARGVKLLVKAVATMVPGHHNVAQDLLKYAKDLDIDQREINVMTSNLNGNNTYTTPPQVSQSNVSYMGGKVIGQPAMPQTPQTTAMTRSFSSDVSNISEISEEPRLRSSFGSSPVNHEEFVTPHNKGILPSSTHSIQGKLNALLSHGKLM